MSFIQKRLAVLEAMDPQRIYVENVRAFLGVRTPFAGWLCRKACRDGFLERWFGFEHPERGNIIYECPADDVPDEEFIVVDPTSAYFGDGETEFKLKQLKKVEFFRRGS